MPQAAVGPKVEELRRRLQPENQKLADKLLLYEPFDDNAPPGGVHGWPIIPTGPASCLIRDGAYFLVDERERSYTLARLERWFDDFIFQVAVSGAGDPTATAAVKFREDGNAALELALRFGRMVELHGGDRRLHRVYERLSPALMKFGMEERNIVEGRCVGDRVKGWLNGAARRTSDAARRTSDAATAEVQTDLPVRGRFACVAAGKESFTARFDDLIVFSVKKDALPPYKSTLPQPVARELREAMGVPLHVERWNHMADGEIRRTHHGIRSIAGGRFIVECIGGFPGDAWGNFEDFVVSVRTTCLEHPDGKPRSCGMLLRVPSGVKGYEWRGYQLVITEKGGQVRLWGKEGPTATLAEAPKAGKASARGKEYVLEALCKGDSLRFFIDGTFIHAATVTDANFLKGRVGTLVQGKGTKAAFDDFVVYSVKP